MFVFQVMPSHQQDRDVRLSKSMSYALRHGASQMGLEIGTGELLKSDLCNLEIL